MRALLLLTVTLVIAAALPAQISENTSNQAQDELSIPRSSDPGKQPFVRTFLGDEVKIWTSPFRGSSYSSRGFQRYVIPFALVTGALMATDHRTANLLPNTESQATWSRRVSQIGAPYSLAGMAAGMYLISKATKDKKARETGFLGATAVAHSQVVTLVLKSVSQRERPMDYQTNGTGGVAFFRGGDSFPSGHSSSSFALATVFAYEYGPEHRWVPYASYGLASVVAASRMSARKHWVSDIFVGGSMGFLIGRYVYKSHHDPRVDGVRPTRAERFVPKFGMGLGTLTLTWGL